MSGSLTHVAHTSAYQTHLTSFIGLGMSAMSKLNSEGTRLELCRTQVLTFVDIDFIPLKQVVACLSLR